MRLRQSKGELIVALAWQWKDRMVALALAVNGLAQTGKGNVKID